MVGQRSREIGIRMALGAQSVDILKLILGNGMFLVITGLAVGLVLAAGAAPLVASLLYGVHPIDLIVFTTVPAVMLIVAFLATYFPARRATAINPITALRES